MPVGLDALDSWVVSMLGASSTFSGWTATIRR